MPLNPLENMPASMIGHNIALNRYIKNLNELKINVRPAEKMEEFKFSPCENLEGASALPHTSPLTYPSSDLLQQPKVRSPRNLNSAICLSHLISFEVFLNVRCAKQLKSVFC
jgi:hypothetical protein